MTSREISEVFMPCVPIVMPSLMAMVLNSIGVPPASRMPRATSWARSRSIQLHGMVPIQVLAIPIIGLRKSSSVKPNAFQFGSGQAHDRALHRESSYGAS